MQNPVEDTEPDKPAAARKKPLAWHGPRLHAGHFAFMRAVIQGLDTRQSWDRYLRLEGEHDDIRHVRRTIQRIRDEFASAARRHARHGAARIIQIDAARIDDQNGKLPTLEEFALERGLEEFSQAEQLDYYREQYGTAPGAASRRRRVIARQLDALRWLEELVAVPPRPEDPPGFWIHPDIAHRLEAAGLDTLEALIRHINGIGHRWWAAIPGIGTGKAERIVSWLRSQESSLRLSVGPHVDLPRRQTSEADLQGLVKGGAAVVPIEKFVPPPGLCGTSGMFRAPRQQCCIAADTDIAAIFEWVASKPANASTRRAYLKEGERFLLWAVLARGKPVSSLDSDDCDAYLRFMADPAPAEVWCGPRGREKWSPLWRPFEGPLSDTACRHAVVVLKNLFNFLVKNGYLLQNPWDSLALPQPGKRRRNNLTDAQWQRIEQFAQGLPRTSANTRLVFALQLIRHTGLRLSEAVSAKLADLHTKSEGTFLRAKGRAGKERWIRLTPDLMDHLKRYLESRGLHPDPSHPDNQNAHLLGQALDVQERAPWSPSHLREVDPRAGIATGTLHDQLKAFFVACAGQASDASSSERATLKAATADWLRTTTTSATNKDL